MPVKAKQRQKVGGTNSLINKLFTRASFIIFSFPGEKTLKNYRRQQHVLSYEKNLCLGTFRYLDFLNLLQSDQIRDHHRSQKHLLFNHQGSYSVTSKYQQFVQLNNTLPSFLSYFQQSNCSQISLCKKVSVFGVILLFIFPHLD